MFIQFSQKRKWLIFPQLVFLSPLLPCWILVEPCMLFHGLCASLLYFTYNRESDLHCPVVFPLLKFVRTWDLQNWTSKSLAFANAKYKHFTSVRSFEIFLLKLILRIDSGFPLDISSDAFLPWDSKTGVCIVMWDRRVILEMVWKGQPVG